jgi:hypothetical protein
LPELVRVCADFMPKLWLALNPVTEFCLWWVLRRELCIFLAFKWRRSFWFRIRDHYQCFGGGVMIWKKPVGTVWNLRKTGFNESKKSMDWVSTHANRTQGVWIWN